jgi:divalent metal cation (Fe/Co/Zn/Cd) transporter
MTEAASLERRRGLHRRAVWLEYFTVGGNVIEGVVAIGAGIIAGSVALIGFGVDSSIEVISALGLLWRLRKAGPTPPSRRRAALNAVPCMWSPSPSSCWPPTSPSRRSPACSAGRHPTARSWGLVLSVLSLVIMPALAWWKQRTGRQMGSRALVADAAETWVCSYLSLALLAGVGLHELFGWWWADPVGVLAMLPVILWQGWETLGEAREHDDHEQSQ